MNGQYNLRIAHLQRKIVDRTRHNEAIEQWPEIKRYSGKRLSLNAGEEIRLGVREGKDFLKLEILGQSIPLQYNDHIRIVATGRVYRITGEPNRLERVTVIMCENV